MANMSAMAKPSLSDAIIKAMRESGPDAPGFRENDGTTYRVLEFDGNPNVPEYLKRKGVGAIAEWANDSETITGLTFYSSLEEFGHDFAVITLVADKL